MCDYHSFQSAPPKTAEELLAEKKRRAEQKASAGEEFIKEYIR